MDNQIAADAHRVVEDLQKDMHDHSLHRIIADIDAEQKKLTPAQYKEFLQDLNKDVVAILPGIIIEGTNTINDIHHLIIKENDIYWVFNKNEEKGLEVAAGKLPIGTPWVSDAK